MRANNPIVEPSQGRGLNGRWLKMKYHDIVLFAGDIKEIKNGGVVKRMFDKNNTILIWYKQPPDSCPETNSNNPSGRGEPI
jgi:hypothetical protein